MIQHGLWIGPINNIHRVPLVADVPVFSSLDVRY